MIVSDGFSSNYLVLVPQELGFAELFRLLWSCEIEKMGFVHSPQEREEYLQNRKWVVFLSLLVQKLLLLCSKWISKFGCALEFWLNLVSSNGGVLMLILDFFRGKKIEIPERESEKFLSIVGNLDRRVELDNRIQPGDCRYFSALAVMASKIAYENRAFVKTTVEDHWKMKLVGYYDFWNDFQAKRTTQAFIMEGKTSCPNMVVVAFRGTEMFDADAWCTDLDLSWYDLPAIGKIHGGFMKALGLLRKQGWPKEVDEEDSDRPLAYYAIRRKLRELVRSNAQSRFLLTGHSLGGALAVLFPAVLALHQETSLLERVEGIYTFGQPRVGNQKFNCFMEQVLKRHGCRYLRFVYSNDIVPRLPTDNQKFMFKHFGTCLYFNSCYQGKEVVEEPYKNYFSIEAAIPRFFVAFWELVRSFLIPYVKGPQYAETWLLKAFRFFGLVFHGFTAHNIQDYVNLTRLGSAICVSQTPRLNRNT